ncbi:MAG: uracil-DNA glycosylase [Pseudomonadota bacterium]
MTSHAETTFDPTCTRCPRLADFLADVRASKPDYHAKPVPSFGETDAQLVVVGLAPGMHGANRTGRPFTGDHAGLLLYETLHQFGFANQPNGDAPDDGLALVNCRIVNAVKCLPPENKPTGSEINQCNDYLANDLKQLKQFTVIVALGTIAHGAVLSALGYKKSHAKFSHGAQHALDGTKILIDSYHCSRYNTQTKRLTPKMFQRIFDDASALISSQNDRK